MHRPSARRGNGTGGRRRLVAASAVVLALALAACSSGGSDAGSTTKPASSSATSNAAKASKIGSYPVGTHSVTWVDKSRTTMAHNGAPELPSRTLPVIVFYPAKGKASSVKDTKDAPPAEGPFPMVLFSHGVTSQGPEYRLSLRVLASAGYVVVAPTYPLSNRRTPGGAIVTDMPNQAKGDIPFLIDQTLAANTASGTLHGLVDPKRIALAGHSLGAVTSITAGYDPCCADTRVKAVAEWSGVLVPLTKPFQVPAFAAHRPLLIVHGTDDHTVPYGSAAGVYSQLGTPKVEVSLPGQGHVPAFVVGEGSPAGKVVVDSTVDFLDAELKGDPSGLTRLKQVVEDAGPQVATLKQDLG
jgi:fermentation-respiration switch protein FrsA (DUF1100 family)